MLLIGFGHFSYPLWRQDNSRLYKEQSERDRARITELDAELAQYRKFYDNLNTHDERARSGSTDQTSGGHVVRPLQGGRVNSVTRSSPAFMPFTPVLCSLLSLEFYNPLNFCSPGPICNRCSTRTCRAQPGVDACRRSGHWSCSASGTYRVKPGETVVFLESEGEDARQRTDVPTTMKIGNMSCMIHTFNCFHFPSSLQTSFHSSSSVSGAWSALACLAVLDGSTRGRDGLTL